MEQQPSLFADANTGKIWHQTSGRQKETANLEINHLVHYKKAT